MKRTVKVVVAVSAVFFLPVVAASIWGWNTSLRQIAFGWPLVAVVLFETIVSFLAGSMLMQDVSQEKIGKNH